MKSSSLIKSLLLVCMLGLCSCAEDDARTEAAISAAKDWLLLVDSRKYDESWVEAAPFFKESVSGISWDNMIKSVREPLGDVDTRELIGAKFMTTLPGAPEGEYVVIQFKTNFANKADAIETITPVKTDDGWRVAGYFIK